MTLLIHPVGSAGMSRMPEPLSSLAAWPVVYGLVFLTRGLGFAFNEVVVSLAGKPGGMNQLRRFARILALSTMGIMALIAFTSLGESWFRDVSGLSAELTRLSSVTIMFAILMPGYQVYQSWYGGLLVHYHRTRGSVSSYGVCRIGFVRVVAGSPIFHRPGNLLDHKRICLFRALPDFLFAISI